MGYNLTEGDGFLRSIKVRSTTFFREEVKPSAPCHKILWHVKEPLVEVVAGSHLSARYK
jgi:hypothetical protein